MGRMLVLPDLLMRRAPLLVAPNTISGSFIPSGTPTTLGNYGNPNELNTGTVPYIYVVNGNEQVMNDTPSYYANKLNPTSSTKANLWKFKANVPNVSDYDVIDLVFRDGPWMIRGIPIFLNKWSPSVSLLKEEYNSFEALNVENHEEVATGSKATTSGTQEEGQSSTLIVEVINVLEKQILKSKLVLVDDDEKLLEKVDYLG
ncbi:hypothetical protein Tco_1223654 [Tanacetum coccineum]